MKRTRGSTRKREQALRWGFEGELADFEPDPVSVQLYRIMPQGRRVSLTSLAWYERNLTDIKVRFGGGLYQIVVRYRGRVMGTRVFEIWGLPIEDTAE